MPRQNQTRTIASEANLAARIQRERGRSGLSYRRLAAAMTDAGCPIDSSALQRIEKGDPPRRISVDELVAFGTVFDIPIPDLLVPIELVDFERARELIERLKRINRELSSVLNDGLNTFVAYHELGAESVELAEYVAHHVDGYGGASIDIAERLNVFGENAAYNMLSVLLNDKVVDLFTVMDAIAKGLIVMEERNGE